MNYSGNDFYCDVALKGKVSLKIEYESEQVLLLDKFKKS